MRDRADIILDRAYGPNDDDTSEACLEDEKSYSLIVYDNYGDGM